MRAEKEFKKSSNIRTHQFYEDVISSVSVRALFTSRALIDCKMRKLLTAVSPVVNSIFEKNFSEYVYILKKEMRKRARTHTHTQRILLSSSRPHSFCIRRDAVSAANKNDVSIKFFHRVS